MNKSFRKKNAGFTLVEILIAAAIIAMILLATAWVAERSIRVSRQSVHISQATFLLEEGAEAVRAARDNAWTNISGLTLGTDYYPTFSSGSWSFSTTPSTVGIFTRKINISSVNRDNTTADISAGGTLDSGTKLVTVTVTWNEETTSVSKTLSFYIMNIFQ